MKKLLLAILFTLVLSGGAFAEKITCVDTDSNRKHVVLYNSNQIKAFGKIFEEVLVSGNSISGRYISWKKTILGGQKIDEHWSLMLSFDTLSKLTVGKYIDGNYEWISERYFECN